MRQALSTLEADGILAIGDEVDVCSPASSTLASWGNATNCNASNEISSHEQIFWITVTASVLTTTSKASMAGISFVSRDIFSFDITGAAIDPTGTLFATYK